jgi:hypothetical protein
VQNNTPQHPRRSRTRRGRQYQQERRLVCAAARILCREHPGLVRGVSRPPCWHHRASKA